MRKWLILRDFSPPDGGGARSIDVRSESRENVSIAAEGIPATQAELPCDWLFAVATEPVLIVAAANRLIVQANPAAGELLGLSSNQLIGRPVADGFHESSVEAIHGVADAAESAATGRHAITCRSIADATELAVTASFFRVEADGYVLIQMASAASAAAGRLSQESPAFEAIEESSVGFVLTDDGFRIEYANQAFVDLVELQFPAELRGQSLVRWLGLSAADLLRMRDQMSERQATSVMAVHLLSERRTSREVEVCAVAVQDGQTQSWGFTIRKLPRLN